MPTPLYRHRGAALLRAAAAPVSSSPETWPDLDDIEASRAWLATAWARPEIADAISIASSGLARRIETVLGDAAMPTKQVRRATVATMRYLVRASGRHTPFGLFAGVAPASIGSAAKSRWGSEHQPSARADTQWVADVVDRLESDPELLKRLQVVFSNLATVRGQRLEVPQGPNRVSVRHTSAVRAVRAAATSPIRFADLAATLAESFPSVASGTIGAMPHLPCQARVSSYEPASSLYRHRSTGVSDRPVARRCCGHRDSGRDDARRA